MEEQKPKIKRLRTIAWAFRIAWSIDKFTMLLWFILCGALAVLPAVALQFNENQAVIGETFVEASTGRLENKALL